MADGIRILSENLSGETVHIVFTADTGSTITDFGVVTIPADLITDYFYGTYSISAQTYEAIYTYVIGQPTPIVDCYVAGPLITDSSNGAVFDRSINVSGMLEVIAGAVGGQAAVPDEFSKKVARSFQLIMDPSATGITLSYQNNLVATLRGDVGTIHEGLPTAQRVGYGNGDDYDPNWLTDEGISGYTGYQQFLDTHTVNDMVWYQSGNTTGDTVITEVFEHIFHTVHLFGIMGAVPGSSTAVNWMAEENPDWQTTDLHLSMKQAIDNGMYDPSGYAPDWSGNTEQAQLAYKEYMYLLNFGMWEMSTFWVGDSLAPEWNDNMRTPSGIQTNNILGYNLFNSYFAPVLTKPSFVTLRNIFQDNGGGVSGYYADNCVDPTPTPEPTNTSTPTGTPLSTPNVTPTITPTITSTPAPTNTSTPTGTPTPTETPNETPTPTPTPIPVTGYGYNLVVLPYDFPSSGNTIMTEQGIGQTGTTNPNVFTSSGGGIYFNSIDNTNTDRTDYFSGLTEKSITITLTQNGDSAIYSGDTNAFQSWDNSGKTGFVFGSIVQPGGITGTTVLIQSATTNWVTGQTVYISAVVNGTEVTPTPQPTNTSTPTGTPTITPTITSTPAPTNTSTPTGTPQSTLTPTGTPTGTPQSTPGGTPTNTPTTTATPAPTNTSTPTQTPTSTVTPSITSDVTPTQTPTNTLTPSVTSDVTPTPQPTNTSTPTGTPQSTVTPTVTATVTPTNTPTVSVSNTPGVSQTPTQTNTVTPTGTPLSTVTPSITPTITPEVTPTITPTASVTPSVTPDVTSTVTPTNTPTATVTSSVTPTITSTVTPTNTPTSSVTPSVTPDVTSTVTPTNTPTASVTPSVTPDVTSTVTPTNTPTASGTPPVTPGVTSTVTPTNTPTSTVTPSLTGTPPVTPDVTPTITPTASGTPPVTPDVTPTITPTASGTPPVTPDVTSTVTPTNTPTSTVTPDVTQTPTSTVTPTVTSTAQSTSTPVPTSTPTSTPEPTTTPNPTSTPESTSTPEPTSTPTPTPTLQPNYVWLIDCCDDRGTVTYGIPYFTVKPGPPPNGLENDTTYNITNTLGVLPYSGCYTAFDMVPEGRTQVILDDISGESFIQFAECNQCTEQNPCQNVSPTPAPSNTPTPTPTKTTTPTPTGTPASTPPVTPTKTPTNTPSTSAQPKTINLVYNSSTCGRGVADIFVNGVKESSYTALGTGNDSTDSITVFPGDTIIYYGEALFVGGAGCQIYGSSAFVGQVTGQSVPNITGLSTGTSTDSETFIMGSNNITINYTFDPNPI